MTDVQQMNPLFLLDFPRKIDVASASKIRFSAFFLGVPWRGFVWPVIVDPVPGLVHQDGAVLDPVSTQGIALELIVTGAPKWTSLQGHPSEHRYRGTQVDIVTGALKGTSLQGHPSGHRYRGTQVDIVTGAPKGTSLQGHPSGHRYMGTQVDIVTGALKGTSLQGHPSGHRYRGTQVDIVKGAPKWTSLQGNPSGHRYRGTQVDIVTGAPKWTSLQGNPSGHRYRGTQVDITSARVDMIRKNAFAESGVHETFNPLSDDVFMTEVVHGNIDSSAAFSTVGDECLECRVSRDGRNDMWRVRMEGMECGEWGWKEWGVESEDGRNDCSVESVRMEGMGCGE